MPHPYETAPDRAFWSKAVASHWDPIESVDGAPLIRRDDRVMSAGSCFAANLVPYLERAGFSYIWTELMHPRFVGVPKENFSYGKFSAAYGNIYTVRQLLQLLQRCLGRFHPVEDRWVDGDTIVDPFRPALRYRARSQHEFEMLTRQHLQRTLKAFTEASVFIFTLGLTEAWLSKTDGAVYPACPGTIAGKFDAGRYVFHNFSVVEVAADLELFIDLLREINPAVRFVLTVSPVPLVATATADHVLVASTYSKSVLRTVAGDVVAKRPNVTYFPAYEIVTGPQAPYEFFEQSRRDPSKAAIDAVMTTFLAHCEGAAVRCQVTEAEEAAPVLDRLAKLSNALADAECEEAMVERYTSTATS
jgi:hypothetical protein